MKTHDYHANIVRYLDKQGNKSIIQIEDKYDQNGLLEQIHFNYIGVVGNNGQKHTIIYDFNNLTVNGKFKTYKGKPLFSSIPAAFLILLINKYPSSLVFPTVFLMILERYILR